MVSVSMDFPFSGNLKEGIDYAMWLTREWNQKQKHKKIGLSGKILGGSFSFVNHFR